MSQRVSENGENRKMLLHDRNWRYCREHSQKLHTNEKLHARERLWSESHFRLVQFAGKIKNMIKVMIFLKVNLKLVGFFVQDFVKAKKGKKESIDSTQF